MDGDRRAVMSPDLAGVRVDRRFLLHSLAGALAALGWGASSAAARAELITCDATATSGIGGLVMIGPLCPVVRVDDPCPDQLFAATLIIRDSQGRTPSAVSSREDGHFLVGLPPRSYELVPLMTSSRWVFVAPDQYTDVTVSHDSGSC
jgi:hypothetical protein